MTTRQAGTILRHIRNLVDAEATRKLTDAQLLQRFAVDREETAFAALMQRHGGLVWGVCQHLLHQEQDAEDAFQATFLVLARRAGSIRKSEAVSSFLYGVAYRIAMKAKQNIRRRQVHERRTSDQARVQPPADFAWRELQAVLDEEVRRLPEKYRGPFILCCLEGRSQKEAARELSCKEGTVSSRIARARRLLQQRLTRRGMALSAALCAAVLWKQTAAATVPAALAGRTIQAATGVAGGVSATAAALAEGVLRVIGFAKWQIGGALILGLSLLAVGAGAWSHRVPVMPSGARSKDNPVTPTAARKDMHGDPLPPGALARFGTMRQRAPDSHLAVTADGKEVVAVGNDLTVRRFDARTGELRAVCPLPRASGALRFQTWLSPRGTFALAVGTSGPRDYHLDLWDLDQRKIRQTLPLSGHPPGGAAFSADERRVAVAESFSNQEQALRVLVWDLETSKSRVVWSEKKDISAVYFDPVVTLSPDGKRLVACHLDRIIRCWDVESGKLLWRSERENASPFLFFSPDGRLVVSGAQCRDAATGKLLKIKNWSSDEMVTPLGFSPDGRFLAIQTGQEEVVLWKPGEEKVTFRFPRPPHRRDAIYHNPNRLPTNFAFTPDGKGFIRRAGALQRWDLDTGKPVYKDTENWGHTEDVTRLVFSPDGRLLASSSRDQLVRLWDVSTARTVHAFPKGGSDHLAFTPDGRFLLTVPYSILDKAVLQATDVTTGRPGRGFELADRREFMAGSRDKEIRVTTDGKKILMLTWKNGRRNDESVLTAWDAATGECLVHKRVPWGQESLLTPDGQSVLAPDTATGTVRLLAVDTGKPRWQLQLDRPRTAFQAPWECDLVMSPDGRLMAVRNLALDLFQNQLEHDPIRLSDMATGRQLQKLPIDGPAIFAFSADNRLFAVADRAAIRLWETATWKEVGSIPVPNRDARPPDCACASSLAFSPDGRTLATGHADGTILLWDATLRGGGHGGPLTDAQREALWADLIGTDAARAYTAVWRLADDPQPSVSFLKERLRPVPPIPPEVIRPLLDDLDSDPFKVREEAERKLRTFDERVVSPLRAALKAKPSLERRRRIEALLEILEAPAPLTGETLRAVRAVQALERIGSAEARKLLEELSQGVESARLTRAAKESLMRLKKRGER